MEENQRSNLPTMCPCLEGDEKFKYRICVSLGEEPENRLTLSYYDSRDCREVCYMDCPRFSRWFWKQKFKLNESEQK